MIFIISKRRIQKQAAEAEEVGAETLQQLRRQGNQMVIYYIKYKSIDLT